MTKAPRSRHALDTTVSYTAMIREAGHEPGVTVISKAVRDADRARARAARARRADEPVLELERVRLADRRPVIYSRDRIPAALLRDVARRRARQLAVRGPRRRPATPVVRASAELLPTLADTKLSELLEVKRGAPLLHIDQVDYDARGRAVMLSLEWHVADAFELIVNRRASPVGGP